MGTKTVFRYKSRDPRTQEWVLSRRMATREYIEGVKGTELQILEDIATEVDESILDSNGQTQIDFRP
jgi:hypothetical protein